LKPLSQRRRRRRYRSGLLFPRVVPRTGLGKLRRALSARTFLFGASDSRLFAVLNAPNLSSSESDYNTTSRKIYVSHIFLRCMAFGNRTTTILPFAPLRVIVSVQRGSYRDPLRTTFAYGYAFTEPRRSEALGTLRVVADKVVNFKSRFATPSSVDTIYTDWQYFTLDAKLDFIQDIWPDPVDTFTNVYVSLYGVQNDSEGTYFACYSSMFYRCLTGSRIEPRPKGRAPFQ
jgi:hypothetical protein